MKIKKRVLSAVLATCLIVTMMPAAAFAAETDTGTGKAIQLVNGGTAANINGGQADNIYFGTYKQSSDGNGGYNTDPIKWRVLSNADGQLFLLSDQNLDVFQYHTDWESVTWEKSTMRSWLNGYVASENTGGDSGTDYTSDNFIGAAFSEKEQAAIADTEVVNDDNPDYDTEGGTTTDKIFLLSIAEARSSSYFADNSSRISTNTAYVAGGGKIGSSGMSGVGRWWLRSPGNGGYRAAYVTDYGGVISNGLSVDYAYDAARPAFHLDLHSVLFTSAGKGGKSASGMDSGLAAVGDYTGNEWKLTLLDISRKFGVTEEIASGKPGDTITLHYTGATIGENEYISVIIANNSGAQYYGRVAQPTEPTEASGQIQIKIPASLADGTYTLNVFSEQYNGDYKTDYASALQEISLTILPQETTPQVPSIPSGGGTVISKPTTSRIAGDDRFETAVEVADQLKKELGVTKFNSIVVAYSDEFADALSASAFAQENEAPVLVVNENNEEYVKKYIEQNLVKGGKVYIMGGNAVVTERFEESLSEYDVSRIGGDDRYETNLSTLKQLNLGGKDTIIIASGLDYADALSASSTGLPIMIVGDKLTDSQIAYLKTLGGDDTYYIAGGTAAVSSEVEKQLKDLNLGTIKRLAGGDRYETSALIAETFYSRTTLAYLASGDDFPDGLTGGVLAGLSRDGKGAPLLLVNERNTSIAASYIEDAGVRTVKAIGGTAAITDETLKAVI